MFLGDIFWANEVKITNVGEFIGFSFNVNNETISLNLLCFLILILNSLAKPFLKLEIVRPSFLLGLLMDKGTGQ